MMHGERETEVNKWNWEQDDWPGFRYKSEGLEGLEREFRDNAGMLFRVRGMLDDDSEKQLAVEIITNEAFHTSEIEGEHLDRGSIQSSLQQRFKLRVPNDKQKAGRDEASIAAMLHDLYRTYTEPLSHASLNRWHKLLMQGRKDLDNIGGYRTSRKPMQVVSGKYGDPTVHFEAPPSERVEEEMSGLIEWFNRTAPGGAEPLPPLARAGMAHIHFESIHPYEDGNGRVGRALSEKALAQSLGRPTLVALATVISKKRHDYYDALEQTQRGNEITEWLLYFGRTVLASVEYARAMTVFTINRYRLLDRLASQLNERQLRVLERVFREGPEGFQGGLSANNYMRIAKATQPTATRDLNDLVAKGALTRSGELKSTRYWIKYALLDDLAGQLNERQSKVIGMMFFVGVGDFVGGLSAENYMRITKATRPTATRDLADLVAKGALTRSGERKSTRYQLAIL